MAVPEQTASSGGMTRYAVLVYDRETPGGMADFPPEKEEALERLPERIAEQGGRILTGMALDQTATATTIRGDLVTDGPFIETKEALAGAFVVEARDLDHALVLGRLTAGVHDAVEIRPLIGFEIVEES